MHSVSLDPGIYLNIFRVILPDEQVEVMIAPADAFSSLRELRSEIDQNNWEARVYRYNDQFFCYGKDMQQLASKGFQHQTIQMLNYPKWCARLITEGLSDHLKRQGYRERFYIGRTKLYEPLSYRTAANGQLHVFRGYDLRAIYVWQKPQPIFGLIIDICWEVQDTNGQRLNTVAQAQFNAVAEIAQIQDEYIAGNRINPEVSRLRLQNHILPFVNQNKEFELPLIENIMAVLEEMPIRVILGASS
ncbi:MAG: hypothetical protein Kow0042_13190 [Calditrichia bacterium]